MEKTDFSSHCWMPEFPAPWTKGNPELLPDKVRPEYASGTWSYATGHPAYLHKRYGEAIDLFRKRCPGVTCWWIRSVADVSAVLNGCTFNPEKGLRSLRFLRHLVLSEGEWNNQPLDPIDWEVYDLILPLYGWQSADSLRRFTKGGLWISKKNGKSGLAGGLGLLHLRAMNEGAPLVWIAAVDRKQASIIYMTAKRMVDKTPCLCDELRPIGGQAGIKVILYDADNGALEALSEIPESKEGINASFGMVDELHVGSRALWSVLAKSFATRREPLMLSFSTAGKYDPGSIGWEQWQYALKVADGTITNDSFLSLVYRATPPEDDPLWWTREEYKLRANPSLGPILKRRFLDESIQEALDDPMKINDVLRYHFNVWTHQSSAMIPMTWWNDCATELSPEAFEESLKGRPFRGGLDLSLGDDLTAFAMWFPPTQKAEPHKILLDFFLPRSRVVKLQQDTTMAYESWADAGLIHLTEGAVVDYEYVREQIERRAKQFKMLELGFDPWNARETAQKLIDKYGDKMIVEIPQGWATMGPATRFVKELIQKKTIQHPNHPILNWHVSNAEPAFHKKSGAYMVTKGDKVRLKVDGFVATIIAGSRILVAPAYKPSIYERQGLEFLKRG